MFGADWGRFGPRATRHQLSIPWCAPGSWQYEASVTCAVQPAKADALSHLPATQQVVLEYRDDGTLVTADEDPVVLGRAAVEILVAAGGKPPVPGKLLRFSIGPGGLQVGICVCISFFVIKVGCHCVSGRVLSSMTS
jgi:hypothetical protein